MKTKPQEVEPFKNTKDINNIKQFLHGKKDKRDYCIFVVGINIGLRAGDLLALKISDVMSEGKLKDEVYIKEEKTSKSKTFTLNQSAKSAINEYLDTRNYTEDDYLFISRKGEGHLGVRPLNAIIKSTAKALEIKANFGTHSLRKTFAYQRYANGISIQTIQKLLNHSSGATTLRYIGITKEIITDAYNSINL